MSSTVRDSDPTFDPDPIRPTRIRHIVVLVSTLMAVLLYLDRFCVSFAVDYIREDLSLTQNQMSWFLSAFFWSYALAQVPSGWLSDRYGARIMLVIYILSWSLFTGLIGAAQSFLLLLITRLGCGLGQSGAYPTSASLVSKWVPFANRGTASAMIAFGGRIGGAIAPLLTAFLIVLFVPAGTPVELTDEDILNGPALAAKLSPASPEAQAESGALETRSAAAAIFWERLPADLQSELSRVAIESRQPRDGAAAGSESSDGAPEKRVVAELPPAIRSELIGALNGLLADPGLYRDGAFRSINLPREALATLRRIKSGETLETYDYQRFNRFLLEGTFPGEIGKLYVQGWRPVMFVYGAAGLIVAGIFWFYFRDRPDEHPRCNGAERELIAAGRPSGAPSPYGKAGMIPLKRLLTSRSMWFICIAQVGTNIGWVFLVTWLPRFLIDVHHVPILERGVMAMVPLAVGFAGMLAGGVFTDRLVPLVGLRWGRRLPLMVTRFTAALGYALCLWFAASPDSWLFSPWLFIAAFSLVAFSTDMGSPATWAFKQDVGGRYVGSILGWGNMWGNLGAAVSPPIYDYFLGEHPELGDWNMMFLVCLVAFVFSGICAFGVDATIPIAPPDED